MTRPFLFGQLFFGLRDAGVPVSLTEWMTLMEALAKGAVGSDLTEFYHIARAVLVKNEAHFDLWDQVFEAVFAEGEMPVKLAEELLQWLDDPVVRAVLGTRPDLEELSLEELRQRFEERLREQTERHDGGNRWVGTGGTSPFGNSGFFPGGIRVGGQGGNRSAAQIAAQRRFRDYRNDRQLDTRALAVALKKLRRLKRKGRADELDIDETIDRTCKDAGELNLVFQPPRKNRSRVLLLMDAGGSMTPHTITVESLFSAASGLNHWRKFEALSFHNCVYGRLYHRIERGETVATPDILRERPADTFLIIVGDAAMAPWELTERYGAIDYLDRNETPGLVWLHRLRSHFHHAVWLNPDREDWWTSWSCRVIGRLFPMFPLTLAGLEDAVDTLVRGRREPVPELDAQTLGA